MSAVEKLVAGRGAIPISELAAWCGRTRSYVYRAIGRGHLRMFGTGRVTADSVIAWYASFNEGGAL
jgi:hypothetical protein